MNIFFRNTTIVIILIMLAFSIASAESNKDKAMRLYDKAYVLMENNQLEQARIAYEQAFALYPEEIDIAKEYMVCLRKLGYIQRSLKIGWEAIEKKPKDDALWQNLGNAFLQAHAWESALNAYKMAHKYNKDKLAVSLMFINLGLEELYNGLFDDAIKSFSIALDINKNDGLATSAMGAAQCAKGDKKTGKDNILLGMGLAASGKKQHPAEMFGKLKGALESENCAIDWKPWLSYQPLPDSFLIQPEKGQATSLAIQQSISRRYALPDYSYLEIITPENFSEALADESQGLFTVIFHSGTPQSQQLLITLLEPKNKIEPEQTKDIAIALGQKLLNTSVEKEIVVEEIHNDNMKGYIFTLTDKQYVDKEDPDDEFKYSVFGCLATGPYLVSITFLTNDNSEPQINELTKILSSISYAGL